MRAEGKDQEARENEEKVVVLSSSIWLAPPCSVQHRRLDKASGDVGWKSLLLILLFSS